jgi:hypothetical protein
LIALIAPFLFACANHIDKFLLERCLPEQKIGPIIIGSSLFSGLALPLITMVEPNVGTISLAGIAIPTATGILSAAAVKCGFWASLFWSFVGQVAAVIILLVFAAAYRRDFVAVLRQRRYSAVVLIGVTEIFFDVGESVTLYATLMAPVALVLLVNSFQPLFVFVLGIAVSILVPELERETLAPKKMLQKGAGIGLMVLGGYLISMDR